MLSTKYLQEIKERCLQATPPPWHYFPCGEKSNDMETIAAAENNADYADFAFMAHARTDIENLVKEYEFQAKKIEELEHRVTYLES